MSTIVWASLALLVVLCSGQGQQCYFTDGSVADNNFPCIDNADGVSTCCGDGHVCLTNGLCFDGRGLYRGGCTDETWESIQCAQYCTQYYYSGLWPCGDGYFSCDYGECSSSFTVPGGRLQVNTELINLLGLDSPTATVTSPAETIMATTTETAVASDGAAPAAQGVSTGAAAGIGVGVGIPLLIAAVVFGALFVMERRKRRSLEQTAPSSYSGHTSYDPYQKGGQVYHGASPGAQSNELDTLSSPHELDSERGAA